MYCSACGKKCPDGAVFCAWCGLKLPELADEQAEPVTTAETAPEPAALGDEPSGDAAGGRDAKESSGQPKQLDLDLDALSGGGPDPEPVKPNPAHRMFQRPQALYPRVDDAQTVRPLAANPAQPPRGPETAAVAAGEPKGLELDEPDAADEPDELDGPDLADAPAPKGGGKARADADSGGDEWARSAHSLRDEPKPSHFGRGGVPPEKRSLLKRDDGRNAKRSPYEREEERPGRSPFEREGEHSATRTPRDRQERPLRRVSFDPDDALPPKAVRGRADRPKPPESARGKAVTASGGMVTPPARRSPAGHSGSLRPQKRPRKDLFFEDLEMPAENFYDEAAEERALARRIKAIVSVALAVGALMVAAWLMWMPGGQIVCAQLNLGAPASAYKALGDQELSSGQVRRASDAYHNALRLDPENYEYAMLVGKTKEMVGDREAAVKAYMASARLKPTAVEPYVRLMELYKVLGDTQMVEKWRAEGYKNTGDATFAPGA